MIKLIPLAIGVGQSRYNGEKICTLNEFD